jgi:HEAT repeat protein
MRHAWESDPQLGIQWIEPLEPLSTSEGPTNLKLLESPDSSDRIRAAQWFATVGHVLEDELKLKAQRILLDSLKDPQQHRQIRQSLASAAIKVYTGDTSQIDQLWNVCKADATIRQVLERWLIEIKHPAALSIWQSRLENAQLSDQLDLGLALDGVASLQSRDSVPLLEALIQSELLTEPLLLKACRCLGQLDQSGQNQLAARFLNSKYGMRELFAALLLVNHADDQAQQTMSKLLSSELQPARRVAYEWFVKHAAERSIELAHQMNTDKDSGIRSLAIHSLAKSDRLDAVDSLCKSMADENASLRRATRDILIQKASVPEFRASIDQMLTANIVASKDLAAEQAIELAVAIKAQQYVQPMIDLLNHPLPQVRIRAAWGIAELELQNEQQMEQVLSLCQSIDAEYLRDKSTATSENNARLSFLFDSLGKARYQPSEELLRRYIPKLSRSTLTRASAIWAIAKVLESSENAELAQQLGERMLDNGPNGEDFVVRYVSALGIGRIGSEAGLSLLSRTSERPPAAVGIAASWSQELLQKKQQ